MKKSLVAIVCGLMFAGMLSGCAIKDMIYAIPDMNHKLSSTNDGLNKMSDDMNQMVSGTSALAALPQLENYDNYDELLPLPYKLMPWGQLFASAVSADQLAQLAHLWLVEISTVQPEQTMDAAGKMAAPTPAALFKADTIKLGRLSALMTVAANLPESTVTQLIQDEIINDGQYQTEAYEILALRAFFINGLLGNDPVYQVFQTTGALDQAVTYANAVDRIALLPYVKSLQFSVKFLEPNGYPTVGPQIQFTMDPSMSPAIWNEIQMAATNDLSFTKVQNVTGNAAADAARMQTLQADYNSQMKVVRARVQYWANRK